MRRRREHMIRTNNNIATKGKKQQIVKRIETKKTKTQKKNTNNKNKKKKGKTWLNKNRIRNITKIAIRRRRRKSNTKKYANAKPYDKNITQNETKHKKQTKTNKYK